MENQIKVGNQYQSRYGTIYTVVAITEKRVIYSDGQKGYCGSTNKRQSSCWLTIKGFQQQIQTGYFKPV